MFELNLITWHSDKKLDSISVSVETQLGVGHGAVRHKAALNGTVWTVVSVDPYGTAGPMWHKSF